MLKITKSKKAKQNKQNVKTLSLAEIKSKIVRIHHFYSKVNFGSKSKLFLTFLLLIITMNQKAKQNKQSVKTLSSAKIKPKVGRIYHF